MGEQDTDGRVAKILGDLLALTLSENAPQSEAAFGAIRRRAERDGVTGGAVKALVTRLLRERSSDPASAEREASGLRFTVADQKRELDETRQARRLAEAALSDTRQANAALVERLGQVDRGRRAGWVFGAAFGGVCLIVAGGVGVWVRRPAMPATSFAVVGFDTHDPTHSALLDFLHSCFLSNSNSLGGGTSFAMHLLIDVGPDGTMEHVRIAPDQVGLLDDPGRRRFSDLVLRTFANGGCGPLPLPASLRGKSGQLDVHLPR